MASVMRANIVLDGKWSFRLDPKSRGEKEKWFSTSAGFHDRINVPGCWQTQGYGKDVTEPIKNFGWKIVQDSDGWYQKKFTVPAGWQDGKTWLEFAGLYPTARVWVNGKFAAEHFGPFSPLRTDVSKFVRAGDENTVTVQIREQEKYLGGACYNIFLWSGIYQGVKLEKTARVWIQNVFYMPDVKRKGVRVRACLAGDVSAKTALVFEIMNSRRQKTAEAKTAVSILAGRSIVVEQFLPVPNAQLWCPETPVLYQGRVSLQTADGARVDSVDTRFGIREFNVQGQDIFLNGEKLFLRGYGDDALYPQTVCPPADKASYRKFLQTAKSFGFNFVRHHTHWPPEPYFEAADEVGMLVQPEVHHWPAHLDGYRTKVLDMPRVRKLIRAEWERCILHGRNHPSIMVYCMGNEMYRQNSPGSTDPEAVAFTNGAYARAKELDPTRLVLRSGGAALEDIGVGRTDLEEVVGYAEPSLDNAAFKRNFAKYAEICRVPFYAHEFGYQACYPNLKVRTKYKLYKPFWIDMMDAEYRKNKAEKILPQCIANTERLQALCRKLDIEEARKEKKLSGYSYWLLKDTMWAVEGVVDDFGDPKNVSRQEFLMSNGEQALLLDMERRCLWSGEKFQAHLTVSNHGRRPIKDGRLILQITSGNEILAAKTAMHIKAAPCATRAIGSFALCLPKIKRARQVVLQAVLKDKNSVVKNEWNLWIFPGDLKQTVREEVVLWDPQMRLEAFEKVFPFLAGKRYDFSGLYRGDWWHRTAKMVIASKVSERLVEYLELGGRVLLISRGDLPEVYGAYFRTPPYNSGKIGNSGTLIRPHPAMANFPHKGFLDLQGYNLCKGGQWGVNLLDLDAWPVCIDPIIRSIPSYKQFKNQGYLAEVGVGKGRLLMTTLNFEETLGVQPEAEFLMRELIRYCLSPAFKPKQSVRIEQFKKLWMQQRE